MAPSPLVMAARSSPFYRARRLADVRRCTRGALRHHLPPAGRSRSRSSAHERRHAERTLLRNLQLRGATGPTTRTQRVGADLSGSRHRGAARAPTPCGYPRRPVQISARRGFLPRPRRRSAKDLASTGTDARRAVDGHPAVHGCYRVTNSRNAQRARGSPEPEISQKNEHHDHDTDDVKDIVHPGRSFPSGVARDRLRGTIGKCPSR